MVPGLPKLTGGKNEGITLPASIGRIAQAADLLSVSSDDVPGVAEAAACAEKFDAENVGVSLTVTPCWCYGSETMDMDPYTPKAVWGFNGTERPGAVYLAAVLAGHTQKGLPAFGIYGRDVQDAGDTAIPTDVDIKMTGFSFLGFRVGSRFSQRSIRSLSRSISLTPELSSRMAVMIASNPCLIVFEYFAARAGSRPAMEYRLPLHDGNTRRRPRPEHRW